MFRRLAVFAGGWTLGAAEAVCADAALAAGQVLNCLQVLVDSSLIQVRRLAEAGSEPRFDMLETVREYAEERLATSAEQEATLARYATWYVAWAEQVLPELTGRQQLVWYQRLTDELANFRVVRAWCQADPSRNLVELRLAAALGRYWWVRAPGQEARQWLSEALAAGPVEPTRPRARALTWCGQLDFLHGEPETGRARLEQALAVARSVGDRALLCLTLRHVALYAADPPMARALLEEAVMIAHTNGDQRELALALSYLARVHDWQGDPDEAYELCTQAVAVSRAAGDGIALADALTRLGDQSIGRGDYASAECALQEALQLSERLGYRAYITTVNRQLAALALAHGDLALARARVRPSLEAARAASNGADGLWPLHLAARLAMAEADHRHGVALCGAVAAWERCHNLRPARTLWACWVVPGDDAALEASRAALGEAEFVVAWAAGQRLSLEAALDQALSRLGADLGPTEP